MSTAPPTVHPAQTAILYDLEANHRLTLEYKTQTQDLASANFSKRVLFDGLTGEEAWLILAGLPENAVECYLSAMERGMSGAKVFALRYATSAANSKVFVAKVGPINKIIAEYDALTAYAQPHLKSVSPPIHYRGETLAVITQPMAGLSAPENLKSLRDHISTTGDAASLIRALFKETLAGWYEPPQSRGDGGARELHAIGIGEIFTRYLAKLKDPFTYPDEWDEYPDLIEQLTGFPLLPNIQEHVLHTCSYFVNSPKTIIHGDLHAQNVLVDVSTRQLWPIDFAWCMPNQSPIIDLVMLECSFKFNAIPLGASVTNLVELDRRLCEEYIPAVSVPRMPYSREIANVFSAVCELRRLARDDFGVAFVDYRRCLLMMTYCHATFPKLNAAYILGSLQVLSALEGGS